MENKAFYITTTLPYVNSDPHVGFAMEIIRADSVARYKKLQGYEVFFNTGTDEHGQKLLNDAQKAGKDVFDYVSEYAQKFRDLVPLLGISEDVHFIRTTDKHHEKAAQELWKKVSDAGFIYKKPYQTKYCVGCELEKTDSELVDGKCPIHPNKEIEIIDEENYFFAFSKVAPLLNELYKKSPNLVIPEFRFNEMKSFLERGLEDFSISRLKSKMSWGVPVPGDDEHPNSPP
jgi:methionyl-tRNA synthetase